jgi:DNA-directed RNA polymerase sigma subunit (sigma70/sigma32)
MSPAEIGRKVGLPDPLSAARAVRALLARKRLEVSDGVYRLVDSRPVDPGEPEAVPRVPRKRRRATKARSARSSEPGRTTYSDVGRVAVERLMDLSRDMGALRGNLRTWRDEARQAKEAKEEAERRAQVLGARVRDLEAKLEMAEANLRTILEAARGTSGRADTVGDAEMDAILAVLRGDGESQTTSETPSG